MVKMLILTKLIHSFNVVPIKITARLFKQPQQYSPMLFNDDVCSKKFIVRLYCYCANIIKHAYTH